MRLVKYMNCIFSGLVILLLQDYARADVPRPDDSRILAVVPVKSGNVDQSVYHQFDRLVPKLKELSKKKVVKLECRFFGQSDREKDVENAYVLASRIEKYLRVRHKLDLDLWVTIDMQKSAKTFPVLTIAVFSDKISKSDSVPTDPPNNEQQ